jgi:hypothetical protein
MQEISNKLPLSKQLACINISDQSCEKKGQSTQGQVSLMRQRLDNATN